MMTGERVGVGHDPKRGAAYVENWVKVLEEDPREIHRAAGEAQRMSDYLVGRTYTREAPGNEQKDNLTRKYSHAQGDGQRALVRVPAIPVPRRDPAGPDRSQTDRLGHFLSSEQPGRCHGPSMIEHLRGREKALEQYGWTGREAEWIALVCLHSGVFTRTQFCYYFDAWRSRAQRFLEALVDRGAANELTSPTFIGAAKACRIYSKSIYRALGTEDIRHRRLASIAVLMRRLLSLDYVLEHPVWHGCPPSRRRCAALKRWVWSRS